jgi:hypothetical protein
MQALVKKCLVPFAAALVSLGSTSAPETVQVAGQQPLQQGPQKAKATDDDSSFVGLNDLALTSWPGLGTVNGLASLPTPMGGSKPGNSFAPGNQPGNPPRDALPKKPTQLPGGRVMPTAPVEPLSPFLP